MTSLNSMKQKLRPLGFYNLDDNSMISAELSAYSIVLDEILDQLEEIEKERFIATAENYGLSMRELAFGSEQNEKTAETRRNILFYRHATKPEDFNAASIKKIMELAGINANIIEYPEQNMIYINCLEMNDPSADKGEIKSMVKEFLPAHLECVFDFGTMWWDNIDSKNYTFDTMDSKNLTWDEIDNLE